MVKRRADYGVVLFFAYPVHAGSASEVSRVGVGAQVFSFHFRTVVFHPSVEHSTVFCISTFVLWPAVVYHPKSLPSRVQMQKIGDTCCRIRKLCVNLATVHAAICD